jgi:hypothetical protein
LAFTAERRHALVRTSSSKLLAGAQKIGGAERALLVMEIARQPDASRNQCDCHDEGQHVSKHSVRVIVSPF